MSSQFGIDWTKRAFRASDLTVWSGLNQAFGFEVDDGGFDGGLEFGAVEVERLALGGCIGFVGLAGLGVVDAEEGLDGCAVFQESHDGVK